MVYVLGFDMSTPVVRTSRLNREHVLGGQVVRAVQDITLEIAQGEFVSIMGPSGSGKSTLISLVGLLDTPTSGQYFLDDRDVSSLRGDARSDIRNKKIGFVFQNFRLLARSTALENVELPLIFKGVPTKKRRERANELLEKVGLGERTKHQAIELSGGEMQRVAIARALANNPSLILADEPTGNLDSKSGADIIALFEELWRNGHTILIITHDPKIPKRTERVIYIKDGYLTESDNGNGNGVH